MKTFKTSRKNKEGAAYAEALITIPVLIAIFAGMLFFHGVYIAKLEAMSAARQAVWLETHASTCHGVPAEPLSVDGLGAQVTQGAGATSGGYAVSHLVFMFSEFLPAEVTSALRAAEAWVPATFDRTNKTEKHAQNKVMCNEQPRHTPDHEPPIVFGTQESGIPDAI